jgi:hypothetical protein
MKFKVKFSVEITRSDALERALQDISDSQSDTGQEPDEIDEDKIVGFGFRS